ncbi:MAG: hypothetical protein IE935_13840 [Micrococcales bacterium]|nr:hypothetical protein [Micrococcales bacterium]
MTDPTEADVRETLAEYERAAQASGEWDGRAPTEFTNDGDTWSPFWVATEGHMHPVGARSTVHRKGVAVPATVYASWEEALPADESWRGLWLAKPTTLFGAYAARGAIRSAFRDAIGDRREPDDPPTGAPVLAPRDWVAEIAASRSASDVDDIRAAMKERREVTPELDVALRVRRRELEPPAVVAHGDRVVGFGARLERDIGRAVPHPPAKGVPTLNEFGSKPISKKQAQRYNSRKGKR